MSSENEIGYVYVLTNPAMPGLVKIGMTTRDVLKDRLRELYSTGVPLPFECYYACRVSAGDCENIEKSLHQAFAPDRINPGREFFRMDPERVKVILKLFHLSDVTREVSAEIEENVAAEDRSARENFKQRRPRLNFHEMGMKDGDILVFKDDRTKQATIAGEHYVMYQGERFSLTALTVKLKNSSQSNVRPLRYWLFGNDSLEDLYDRCYPIEAE